MMKTIFVILGLILSILVIHGQESALKLHFSGYKVIIIPSNKNSVEIQNPELGTKEVSAEKTSYTITDQRGRVPKDTAIVYCKDLKSLYLHNSVLEVQETLRLDSLILESAAAFGRLDIEANYLLINIGAGSRFTFMGKVDEFDCNVGAGSSLDAANLDVNLANLDVMGHSNVTLNAKTIVERKIENSSFENKRDKK